MNEFFCEKSWFLGTTKFFSVVILSLKFLRDQKPREWIESVRLLHFLLLFWVLTSSAQGSLKCLPPQEASSAICIGSKMGVGVKNRFCGGVAFNLSREVVVCTYLNLEGNWLPLATSEWIYWRIKMYQTFMRFYWIIEEKSNCLVSNYLSKGGFFLKCQCKIFYRFISYLEMSCIEFQHAQYVQAKAISQTLVHKMSNTHHAHVCIRFYE